MKQFFIFILSCISLCTNAQEYLPILTEGKTWVTLYTFGAPEYDFYRTSIIKGDTIINGTKCKRIIYYSEDGREVTSGGRIEEGKKVYAVNEDGSCKLQFDFGMHTGDTYWSDNNHHEVSIMAEDSIEVRGVKRRRLTIGIDGEFKGYWVEGIGSNWENVKLNYPNSSYGYQYYTYECYENGELVFTMDDFSAPTVCGVAKPTAKQQTEDKIYDISGMNIQKPKKGNLYIKGGKKYIE